MENQDYMKNVTAYQNVGRAKKQSMLAVGLVKLSGIQQVSVRRVPGSNHDLSEINHIDFLA